MSFNSRTEEYYKKFIELQEKLRKSEEERLKLEIKFNEMLQVTREEEQMHYRKLRSQYKRFLEEDRRRQDRNERILRTLERIENRVAMLTAKTERFKLLRQQYQTFLDRIYKVNELKKGETVSVPQVPQEKPREKLQPVDEKGDLVQSYIQNLSSQKLRDMMTKEEISRSRLPLTVGATAEEKPRHFLNEHEFKPNYASSIADDIMSSIYSRHKIVKEPNNNLEATRFEQVRKPTFDNEMEFEAGLPKDIYEGSFVTKPSEDSFSEDLSEPSAESVKNSFEMNRPDDKLLHAQLNTPEKRDDRFYNPTEFPQKPSEKIEIQHAAKDNNVKMYQPINQTLEGESLPLKTTKDVSMKQEHESISKQEIQRHPSAHQLLAHEQSPKLLNESEKRRFEFQEPTYKQEIQRHPSAHQLLAHEQSPKLLNESEKRRFEFQEPTYKQEIQRQPSAHQLPAHEQALNESETRRFESHYDNGAPMLQKPVDKIEEIRHQVTQPEHPKPESPKQKIPCENIELTHDASEIKAVDQPVSKVEVERVDSRISLQYPEEPTSQQYQVPEEEKPRQDCYDESEKLTQQQTDNVTYEQPQYDENKVEQQYVESDQPIQMQEYDSQFEQQYDETGQLVQQYDEQGQFIQKYDQTGQLLQYDNNGQSVQQYTENGQAIQQYTENGQVIQQQYDEHEYDQSGQPIQYDENGQPIQQYDENGQPIQQYDDNGQPFQQYADDAQLQQYDQNGQPIQQYDENGQPIQQHYDAQYDENGQPIQQYDEHGQPYSQYDENGQLLDSQIYQQYNEHGQLQQYDSSGQLIPQYDENGQLLQHYSENEQQFQYDENGQVIQQYDVSGDPSQLQYSESGDVQQYDEQINPVQSQSPQQEKPELESKALEQAETLVAEYEDVPQENLKDPNEATARTSNVMEMLDTDTESTKQTTKVSNDSDFDFSNG